MKIVRNLKSYINSGLPLMVPFEYKRFVKENSPSIRHEYLKCMTQLSSFKLYSLICEMKSLLTVVQQSLSGSDDKSSSPKLKLNKLKRCVKCFVPNKQKGIKI